MSKTATFNLDDYVIQAHEAGTIWANILISGQPDTLFDLETMADAISVTHIFRDIAIAVTLDTDPNSVIPKPCTAAFDRYMQSTLNNAWNAPTRPDQERIAHATQTLNAMREHAPNQWATNEIDMAIAYLAWFDGRDKQALELAQQLDFADSQNNLANIISQAVEHDIKPKWTERL